MRISDWSSDVCSSDLVGRDGTKRSFAVDEHPRRDTSMERLASLKVLHPEIEGFSITAGNAAGANDGAAPMVIAADDVAADQGREPLAVVRSWASVGVTPADTGLSPTTGIPNAPPHPGPTPAAQQ